MASPDSAGWVGLALLLAGCAGSGTRPSPPAPAPAPAAAHQWAGSLSEPDADPFPSTYRPFPSHTTLIRNATILTAAGPVIHNGSVLLADGKIAAVGSSVDAPADATVIDANGRYVTPGIIDVHSHIGVYAAPGTMANADGNEMTNPVTPNVWAEHSVWPQDPQFPRVLAGGVTTVQILPGSANLFGGRTVVLKVVPARGVQEMKFPGARYGMKMACGENPKRAYAARGASTRMGNVAGYRAAFIQAAAYRRKWDEWNATHSGPPPVRDLGMETLAEVLRGNMFVHIHCYRADDMLNLLGVAKEFGFTIRAFHHATDAYKIADELREAGTSAAVWAHRGMFSMETMDHLNANLALLDAAGVRAMIHSDDPGAAQHLPQEVAEVMAAAKEAGIDVSDERAIRWLTINPAWALGLDDKVGSLEVGKNADVVLWSGDPFSVYTVADKVWTDGALLYDRSDPIGKWRTDFELGYIPAAR